MKESDKENYIANKIQLEVRVRSEIIDQAFKLHKTYHKDSKTSYGEECKRIASALLRCKTDTIIRSLETLAKGCEDNYPHILNAMKKLDQ